MNKIIKVPNRWGFSLLEILLVLVLIGIIATLVLPFTISYIERQKEKKMILDIITLIRNLKNKSIASLQLGKITLEDGLLVLYLDNQIINKINSANSIKMERDIFFNRNGVSGGGMIQLKFSKNYHIIIEKLSGIIKLEIGDER
jgi:prepilin-type N-terminal cleavage/methylation domain-containing protein